MKKLIYSLAVVAFAAAGCGSSEHDHNDGTHSHDDGSSHTDHDTATHHQEEFNAMPDSTSSHMHEDGSSHTH